MVLTRLALSNPVAAAVGGILVILFGTIALTRLPVQMTPEVERPVISIGTNWRAAAPAEVESEILEPQEDVLRGLPGAERITGNAEQGEARIRIEFALDVDIQRALVEVINRLNQVQRYPVDADEPSISVGGRDFGDAIGWFAIQTVPGNDRPIASYESFVQEQFLPQIERVPGVGGTRAFGGQDYEVRVQFDPYQAANLGLLMTTAVSSQLGSNEDVSAGFEEVGRRRYTIRFSGKLDVEELGDLVLEWREGQPVRLRDVADISLQLRDKSGLLIQSGVPSIAMNVSQEPGSNLLEVANGVKAAMAEMETRLLTPNGLRIIQLTDDSVYVEESIAMVRNNLVLGIILAIAVLWWFLRKFRATMMVALSIPLCLFGAFMVLFATGRSLNIISLAGLAFATGMVLDAAIVTLENIVRLKEKGLSSEEAASRGTRQVWGALLASTVTTVAIFMPVVFLRDESGQLFGDLAITISAAIVFSLFVATTILPAAAMTWLGGRPPKDQHAGWWQSITEKIMWLTRSRRKRIGWIAGLTAIPLLLAVLFVPPPDYLPEGKQNGFRAFLSTPPGLSIETAEREIVSVVAERLNRLLDEDAECQLHRYYLGFFGSRGFVGGSAEDPDDLQCVVDTINEEVIQGLPDTFGFASRNALFGGRGGRRIDVDLQADDFESLLDAAKAGMEAIQTAIPGVQVEPDPGLELGEPELRLIPDDRRIAEAGLTRGQVAGMIRALGDGAFVGEYFDGDRRLNVILRAEGWETPEELLQMPMATPSGDIETLGDLVTLERTAGPSEIRRIDRRRTLSLEVTPPSDMPLSVAIDEIAAVAEPEIRPLLPEGGSIAYRGSAEALTEALTSLSSSFILAIVILYLLISALFRSFRDSLLVILTIPMATVGGLLTLRLVDWILTDVGGQAMDVLTMIGFVILLGLVVNNAILLVYRARDAEAEGMSRREAVHDAVAIRLRPILMSTMTSVFGMLPLLLVPGSGSELYRGMAAVIVGGMLISTVFTLLLLPSLLRLGEENHPAESRSQDTPAPDSEQQWGAA